MSGDGSITRRDAVKVGLILPMTAQSVAAYLGIVKAGAVAVGIADSFSGLLHIASPVSICADNGIHDIDE